MSLHQPGEDLEIGVHVSPVHTDGGAPGRIADRDERGRIVGVVGHDGDAGRGHPVVDEAADLSSGHGPVRAGGHQNADVLGAKTRLQQTIDDGPLVLGDPRRGRWRCRSDHHHGRSRLLTVQGLPCQLSKRRTVQRGVELAASAAGTSPRAGGCLVARTTVSLGRRSSVLIVVNERGTDIDLPSMR